MPISIALAFVMVALELPPAGAQTPPERPRPPQTAQGPPFVPGELLVRFRPAATPVERASVRARHGLQKVQDLPLPGLELVRAPGRPIPDLAAAVAREAAVRDAEPNHLWFQAQVPPPNDPEFGQLWGLHNTGQTGGTPGADIDSLGGWERAADTTNIVVAVLDTGVWIDHPDLREQIWLNRGELPPPDGPQCDAPPSDLHDCNGDGVFDVRDYEGDSRVPGPGVPTPEQVRVTFQSGVDDDGNGRVDDIVGWNFVGNSGTVFDPLHGDDHGTHVAGTIAATIDNGIGVAGVSRARIMPLKFLGPQGGTTANAILALDYALQMGAHVTNNSWGGGPFNSQLQAKIAQADAAGQLFVAAAGNDGRNTDSQPFYPASYPNPNIISVAATSSTDGLASFSNYGATTVDLGAPGVSILSTVPRFSKAVLRSRTSTTAAVAYHTFGLEGIASASQRQALLGAALSWMEVGASDPILLVDDDGGRTFQSAYQTALAALGFTSVTTTTVGNPNPACTANGPTAATMAGYRAVIWITGDTAQCTLTTADQNNITTYVNGQSVASPRNLLLFGQDIGYDLTEDGKQASTFMQQTLRADFVSDADLNFRLSSVPGSAYAGVPDFVLDPRSPSVSPPGGQLFSSAIAPRAGAMSALRGADTTWFPGTSMAAPHVTGVVAHVLAKAPALEHLEVKARVIDTGDPTAPLAGKTVSGKRLNLAGALAVDAPAAPTSLTATARASGSIELSWTASSGPELDGYRVYRATGPGVPATPEHLVSGSEPIAGTFFTDSDTADGTTYFYVVRAVSTVGVESLSSNETSAAADATPPTITEHSPLPGATGVGTSTQVRATFSEALDPSTVGPDTVILEGPSAEIVSASVAYEAGPRRAVLAPDEPLDQNTTYAATVTTGVTDLAGNPLADDVVWSFTTAQAPDTLPPTVAVIDPAPGDLLSGFSHTIAGTAADDVAVEEVEVAIRDASGKYWDGGKFEGTGPIWHTAALGDEDEGSVPWTYGWSPLPAADGDAFTIEARAMDSSANPSDLESVTVEVDTVAPVITMFELEGGATHTNSSMVSASLLASDGRSGPDHLEMRVGVEGGSSGTWQIYQDVFDLDLGESARDDPYTVVVEVRDEVGNVSPSAEGSIVLDRTPPDIIDRTPVPDAEHVPVTTTVLATFSEPVDPATATEDTFILSASPAVPGEVTYDPETRTVTLTPDEPLDHDTTYTATVTTGVRDLADNPLTEEVEWSFTTAAAPPSPPLAVSIERPQEEATPVRGTSLEIEGLATGEVAAVDVAIRDPQGRSWDGAVFVEGGPVWHPAELQPPKGDGVPWVYVWTPLPSSDGEVFTIEALARDLEGSESEVESVIVEVDTVAPADPHILPLGRFQRDRGFGVAWITTDGGGLASYRVQHRWRHFNGNGSGWSLLDVLEEEETRFHGRPGRTHCFRVKAFDRAGNVSVWSAPRCTSVPLNDGALRRQGGWRRVTGRPAHYLGSFVRTSAQGATLRKVGIRRADGAALLFTSCPRCGRVEIRWNGRRVQRLNLRSAQRRTLRVRRIPGVSGRGTLEVVVLSRNRPVIIEGLGVAVRP